MPKTKISEFSATPANNTDIDSINIAEGCAPSGINDAIRELMSQLKDFQTGAVGDSFNGPVGSSTAAAGAFTTLSASGTATLSGLTASTALALDASKNVVSVTNTGSGSNVLATSPTLVTPVLGVATGTSFQGIIGNVTPAAGSFTTLGASSTATLNTLSSSGATLTGGTINGMTIGATTASTGAFTTLSASSTVTLSGGTANGVTYLNGSKVVTSGSALTWNATNFSIVPNVAGSYTNTINLSGSSSNGTKGHIGQFADSLYLTSNYYYDSGQNVDTATYGSAGIFLTSGTTTTSYIGFGITAAGGSGLSEKMRISGATGGVGAVGIGYTSLTSVGDNGLAVLGNVGIGTNSPLFKLQSNGTVARKYVTAGTSGSPAEEAGFIYADDTSTPVAGMWFYNAFSSNSATQLSFKTRTSGGTVTEAIRIDASQNMGLGNTAPTSKLNVSVTSNGALANNISINNPGSGSGTGSKISLGWADGTSGYTAAIGGFFDGTGTSLSFLTNPSAGGTQTECMRLTSAGDLLVATTSAVTGYKVHSSGAFYQDQTANGSSGSSTLSGGYVCGPSSSTIYAGIRFLNQYLSNNISELAFYTTSSAGSATEAGRFDGNGNLLVSQTAQVNGEKLGVTSSSNTFLVKTTGNNSTARLTYVTQSTGTTVYDYYICNSTNTGTISTNGTTTSYNITSDQRLKENIQDADSSSSLIDSLQVRKFDWKTDQTHQRYGFVAQELVTVAPEAVYQPIDTEEMMAVDYSKLVPMLVKEIQSLRQRLSAANL